MAGHRLGHPRADTSCCTPRHCTATRVTASPSVPLSPILNSRRLLRWATSTARRQGLSRPQPSRSVQGLDQRPGPPGHPVIRREMRRRAAIKPVIGHLKDDHRMRRTHLKGRQESTPCAPPRLQLQPAPAMVQASIVRPVADPSWRPLSPTARSEDILHRRLFRCNSVADGMMPGI
jgi:hypothetical protein